MQNINMTEALDYESSSSGDSIDQMKPSHIDDRIIKLSKLICDQFLLCNPP